MDEQAAFLDAIRDAPDDDAHRLVFADWLEERGRAEAAAFLRAHVALARFHGPGEDPFERHGLLNVMALRPAVRDALLEPFAPQAALLELMPRGGPLHEELHRAYQFYAHRGLVEVVHVGTQAGLMALAARPEALRLAAVRFVSLQQRSWWLAEDAPVVANHITESGLGGFLASEAIELLEAIDLRRLYLSDQHIATIIRYAKPLRKARLRLYVRGGPPPPTASLRRHNEALGPQRVPLPPLSEYANIDDEIPF
jgi:uncharacterized protein (TIGR02996 family)